MPQRLTSIYNPEDYSILSINFKPAPFGPRRSNTAVSSKTGTEWSSQSDCGSKTTQSECTIGTHTLNPTEELTTPTTGHVYRPTFPPISLNECGYLQLGPMERLPFAQYPVSHFTQQDWDIIWERPVIDLDPYLMTMEYDNCPNSLPTVFHPEWEFAGYSYHVELDASCLQSKIFFRRGTAVDVRGINRSDGWYLVEYCQLIHDGIAYLPVHFREYHNKVFLLRVTHVTILSFSLFQLRFANHHFYHISFHILLFMTLFI